MRKTTQEILAIMQRKLAVYEDACITEEKAGEQGNQHKAKFVELLRNLAEAKPAEAIININDFLEASPAWFSRLDNHIFKGLLEIFGYAPGQSEWMPMRFQESNRRWTIHLLEDFVSTEKRQLAPRQQQMVNR